MNEFTAAATSPPLRVPFWNRSFMALVLAPEYPMADWFAGLDEALNGAPAFFRGRPLVVDLSAALRQVGPAAIEIVLEGLESRGLRLVAIEGADSALLANGRWRRLAQALPGRDLATHNPLEVTSAPTAKAGALLVDRPVRSGQSVVFEDGDITVLGAVSSGAEVIAGGSIHVYGPLRGRALAGLRTGPTARVFCASLEAEMVGVDQLYRVADHWGPRLHGQPVQVLCDRGALRLVPLY